MLSSHRVPQTPNCAFYVSNFVSIETEQYLLKKIYEAPKPKWTCLSNRRLQNWGGLPHPKGMVQENLPRWLQDCCQQVTETEAFGSVKPHHVLVNEYRPGQGIMPHKDGGLYYPTVTVISLGCYTVLDFYKEDDNDKEHSRRYEFSLLLEPRSLLVFKDLLFTDYLHGIAETETDNFDCKIVKNADMISDETLKSNLKDTMNFTLKRNSTRVSLTIRNVPHTIKFGIKT